MEKQERRWVEQVGELLGKAKRNRPVLATVNGVAIDLEAGPVLDQSRRARAQRRALQIAAQYGWISEVFRALDDAQVVSMEGLTDEQLYRLRDRMERLETCLQEGLDPPDSPPAR